MTKKKYTYSLWCKDFINPSFNNTTKLWTADSGLKQEGTKQMKALLRPWSLRFNLSTSPALVPAELQIHDCQRLQNVS